jgi:hypothetical protein
MSFPRLTSVYGALFLCEITFLILAYINIRRLQKHHLGIVVTVAFWWVLLHLLIGQLYAWKIIRTNNILEALLLVFGLKFLTSLKKERLELMLAWIFLSLSCDLICDYFARRAWYNNWQGYISQ